MDQFGYTCRRRGRSGRRSAQKVAKEHPGYIIGNMGDSYSHWLYLWPDRARSRRSSRRRPFASTRRRSLHPHGELLDPLIKSGVVPPESIFTPAFAQKYGGDDRQDPAHARADLVREGHLRRDAEGAGRRDDGRDAAAVEQRGRARPARSAAARGSCRSTPRTWRPPIDFVKFVTTSRGQVEGKSRRGIPSYGPAATVAEEPRTRTRTSPLRPARR